VKDGNVADVAINFEADTNIRWCDDGEVIGLLFFGGFRILFFGGFRGELKKFGRVHVSMGNDRGLVVDHQIRRLRHYDVAGANERLEDILADALNTGRSMKAVNLREVMMEVMKLMEIDDVGDGWLEDRGRVFGRRDFGRRDFVCGAGRQTRQEVCKYAKVNWGLFRCCMCSKR